MSSDIRTATSFSMDVNSNTVVSSPEFHGFGQILVALVHPRAQLVRHTCLGRGREILTWDD